MSVTVETGTGRKSLVVELNVVPFIDFLSCLIAFLMLGAVWAQVTAIELEQDVGQDIDEFAGPGGDLGRSANRAPDWETVRALVAADRALFPGEQRVVINTDDGIPYEQVVAAMDLTRELGYEQTLLAGGAPVR